MISEKKVHRRWEGSCLGRVWGVLGKNYREEGLGPWLCPETRRRNWTIGWGVRAAADGIGDSSLRGQAG